MVGEDVFRNTLRLSKSCSGILFLFCCEVLGCLEWQDLEQSQSWPANALDVGQELTCGLLATEQGF